MKTANELKQERFELLEKLDALNTKVGERAFEEKEQSEKAGSPVELRQ